MFKVRRFEGPSTISRKIQNARKYRIYHQAIESISALCLPHLHPENRNIILSPQDNTQNEIFVFKVGGMDHGQYNSLRGYIAGNT